MDLENRVLDVFQKNPEKEFTTIEILINVYRIKPTKMLHFDHYSKLWEVQGAINSLVEKGKIDWRIIFAPRYAALYRLKKEEREENHVVTE